MLLRFDFFGYADGHVRDAIPLKWNIQIISKKKPCQVGENGNSDPAFGTTPQESVKSIATSEKAGLAQLVEQLICNQ